VGVPGVRTPLKPAIDGLVRVMRHVHARNDLQWHVAPFSDSLTFRGEEQDLQEMLGNLLDNAGKWARHRVCVDACANVDGVLITIDDDGPGVAADRREQVFGRGVRDDEKVAGSGLGLAIVDDLARLYKGRLELAESPLGGLRVSLNLPVA
jgi:signal transduction histidine kinase